MKKLIGWPLCKALYYIAHWAYLILDAMPDANNEVPGRIWHGFWWVYQRGMAASVDVNDWAGLSVWSRPNDHVVMR